MRLFITRGTKEERSPQGLAPSSCFFVERPSLSFEEVCRPQFLKLERVFNDPNMSEDKQYYHFLWSEVKEVELESLSVGQKKSLFKKLL